MGESSRGIGYESDILHHALDAGYEAGVLFMRKAATDADLEFGKGGVLFEGGKEGESFGEYEVSCFFEVEGAGAFGGFIAGDILESGADEFVHDGVEVREHVEGGTDVFAEFSRFADRIGEDGPDVGYGETTTDSSETVRGEEVSFVEGLAIGFACFDADDAGLEFVANNQDGGNSLRDCQQGSQAKG